MNLAENTTSPCDLLFCITYYYLLFTTNHSTTNVMLYLSWIYSLIYLFLIIKLYSL